MQRRNKVGGILDRRFGENDPTMAPEDKMLERFAREKQRSHKKNSMFDLEDDEPSEGLTHMGKSLSFDAMDDFKEDDLDEDYDSDGSVRERQRLKRIRALAAEGSDGEDGENDEPERKKTKKLSPSLNTTNTSARLRRRRTKTFEKNSIRSFKTSSTCYITSGQMASPRLTLLPYPKLPVLTAMLSKRISISK
jgi:hypothetical protein